MKDQRWSKSCKTLSCCSSEPGSTGHGQTLLDRATKRRMRRTIPAVGTPDSEIDIDENLIGRLIAAQVPDLARERIEIVANGWDNVTARVGNHHAARLPRRQVAVELIRNEQRWLPTIAEMLDVAIPVPMHEGTPGDGYQWPWSVVPWIDGTTAEQAPLDDAEAARFGRFLAALHTAAPPQAPHNPFRGTPLINHDLGVQERWAALHDDAAIAPLCSAALAIWEAGVAVPPASTTSWVHGDLHPRNIVSSNGEFTGVIDWGDINAGDPATDLASVWMQFRPDVHDTVWDAYGGVEAATRTRARAWAISFAGILIRTGLDDDPGFLELGKSIAERTIEAD